MYSLKISKLYDEDVDSCYDYIRDTLQNQKAADDLIFNIMDKLKKSVKIQKSDH